MTNPNHVVNPATREAYRLVVLAAAILYLELALIRFTSAQVLYLGYFSNFILISAFVGLGLGFLAARRELDLTSALPFTLLFLFALVLVSEVDADTLRNRGSLFFFGNRSGRSGLPSAFLLPLLFLSTATIFAALAQATGRLFLRMPPLRAYTLDVAGSLFGILLFTLQSFLWAGPVPWVLTATLLVAAATLLDGQPRRVVPIAAAGFAVVVLLLSAHSDGDEIWSTYQKLTSPADPRSSRVRPVFANGVLHQWIQPATNADRSFYGIPFEIHRQAGGGLDRVLIVGAGSGTDVAVALRRGARQIDAVEIDEAIVELGRRHHPDRPYHDPRVTVEIADGREFLERSGPSFDLILYALPDSLILLSSHSNLRLESYLFTVESFVKARARLKPRGTLALYNQYRWRWLEEKVARMLAEAFGHQPLSTRHRDTVVFAVGDRVRGGAGATLDPLRLATDDWPFLYMQRPGIAWPYLGMIGMFVLAALIGIWLLAPAGALRRPDWAFFLMGVSFLLLETRSISLLSLLFGSTWLVNSLAFGGVLVSVLCANLVASRFSLGSRWPIFALLLASLLIAAAVPAGLLLQVGSRPLRYLLAVLLAYSPVFLANVVFSREFRDTEEATRAFGWNLLGAVVGGGLEYLSLLFGHARLLWIAGGCYLCAALTLRRSRHVT